MELEERIINQLHTSLGVSAQTIEHYAPIIADASELLMQCLMAEGKVLTAGNGAGQSLASYLTTLLMQRFRHERPGLPALTLGSDMGLTSGTAEESGFVASYARQIQALGQPGDLLVLISSSGKDRNLIQAIQAAHEREMSVIAITARDGGDVTSLLVPQEIEICIPADDEPAIHLAQMLTIHCLIDLVEFQLFGA
jgi:D-sedoheptulose 7-phosphate isomerase